jgi:hypothetical protein
MVWPKKTTGDTGVCRHDSGILQEMAGFPTTGSTIFGVLSEEPKRINNSDRFGTGGTITGLTHPDNTFSL